MPANRNCLMFPTAGREQDSEATGRSEQEGDRVGNGRDTDSQQPAERATQEVPGTRQV